MTSSTQRRGVLFAVLLLAPAFAAAAGQAQATESHTATDATVTGPGGVEIAITVFKPADAGSDDPVPVLLHGHGWSGSRWTEVSQAQPYLDAGYGVVSIDQRGHGESGGAAHVMDPDLEAEDDQAVVDHVATLDWAQLDEPGDPVLGAIGGSYGGGYQFVTALDEVHETGDTRFDALSPDITWHNLTQSLAPNGVIRSAWVDALYGLAKASGTEVAPFVDRGFRQGVVTGEVPEDVARTFHQHSPSWFVQRGTQLDVPTLISQGEPDNLFPLNQAVDNWQRTLTPDARQDSLLLGHLTGHTLPSLVPPGSAVPGSNPCADAHGGMTDLRIAFFDVHLKGQAADLPDKPINLATEEGTCLTLDNLPGTVTAETDVSFTTTTGPAGAPIRVPLPGTSGLGPVSGIPTLEADVGVQPTPVGEPARLFVGLAVGTTAADARVLGNQWMPIEQEQATLVLGERVDLAGVSAEIGANEQLFLVVSTNVDQFAHHANRVPTTVTIGNVAVDVPVAG